MIEAIPSRPMRPGLPRPPPPAWVDFARRHPDQDALAPVTVPLTAGLLRRCEIVNRTVNALGYRREARDRWYAAPFDAAGRPELRADGFDCEDQALTKRAVLAARHRVPLGALRLALCTAAGEYHAVLLLCTALGEFVMDNGLVHGFVSPWDRLPIVWHARWAGRARWEDIREGPG